MKIIIVLAIITAAYFLLKFLQDVTKRLGKKNYVIRVIDKIFPLIVSVIWMVILFWTLHYLFYEKSYYNILVICIIVIISAFIGWFFMKDFIAGVIFRLQNNYTEGDYVQFGDTAGQVETLYLTHISLHTKDGKVIRIPYSRLSIEIISQRTELKVHSENSYVINTDKSKSSKSMENIIRNILITSPWRITSKQPDVKFIGEDEKFYKFQIQVEVRNQTHFNYLINALEKRIAG